MIHSSHLSYTYALFDLYGNDRHSSDRVITKDFEWTDIGARGHVPPPNIGKDCTDTNFPHILLSTYRVT